MSIIQREFDSLHSRLGYIIANVPRIARCMMYSFMQMWCSGSPRPCQGWSAGSIPAICSCFSLDILTDLRACDTSRVTESSRREAIIYSTVAEWYSRRLLSVRSVVRSHPVEPVTSCGGIGIRYPAIWVARRALRVSQDGSIP